MCVLHSVEPVELKRSQVYRCARKREWVAGTTGYEGGGKGGRLFVVLPTHYMLYTIAQSTNIYMYIQIPTEHTQMKKGYRQRVNRGGGAALCHSLLKVISAQIS